MSSPNGSLNATLMCGHVPCELLQRVNAFYVDYICSYYVLLGTTGLVGNGLLAAMAFLLASRASKNPDGDQSGGMVPSHLLTVRNWASLSCTYTIG